MSLLLLQLAEAGTTAIAAPAKWAWPEGREVLYHVETAIYTPRGVDNQAKRTSDKMELETRAREVQVKSDVSCHAEPEGKGWLVSCGFGWLELSGTAWDPRDQVRFDQIVEAWEAKLSSARVEFVLNRDGRQSEFDLVGVEGRDAHENYMIEQQRTLFQRVFCVFDYPVPSKGEDWVRGWTGKGSNAMLQLQVTGGTVGVSEIKHRHVGEKYGYVQVDSSGKALLSPGAALEIGSSQTMEVQAGGELLFDAAEGVPAYRDFTLDARYTASSVATGADAAYYQAAALQRIEVIGAPGSSPLALSAIHAARVSNAAPALPEGVALVPFAELGMQPLYVDTMPENAKPLQLPTSIVTARVLVGADGMVTGVTVIEGYAALETATVTALEGARFTKRDVAYAVDVGVEWRR